MERKSYWTRGQHWTTSRRSLLRNAAIGGLGLGAAALVGCGDDEDGEETVAATAPPPTGATEPASTDPFAHVKRGGIYQTSQAGDPPTLDPYGNLSFLTKGFSAYVYSRLYKIGARADINPNSALPEPDLAESAESDDGQTWIVKLRPGARFHNLSPVDGREVTAEDVMFSWDRLTAEGSPNTSLVEAQGLLSAEAIDERTLKFEQAEPSPTFLDFLADANNLWVMPVESEGLGRNSFDPAQIAIGSGPWILDQYRSATRFDYSKHPDWHFEGRPFLDGVRIAIIPEYQNRLAQFRAGNIHVQGINANDVLDLRSDQPELQWRGLQAALLSFIYFSPEDQEPDAPWRDERFRQAVSMAQDRKATIDFAYNVPDLKAAGLDVKESWNNLIPAGFTRWWLDPQSAEQGPSSRFFDYDPEEAKRLLAAIPDSDQDFTYRYTANRYGSTFNSIAEAIGNFLLEVGLNPETSVEDYSSRYITQTFRGDFTGLAFGYETPFPEVGGYFPRMFGDDAANHTRIRDAQITALAAKQASELDEETRRDLIWDIQRVNAEHMYYIPQQAGAGTGWTSWRPEVRGVMQTRGYGGGTEVLPHYWLDV